MPRYDHPGPGDFASPTELEPLDEDEPNQYSGIGDGSEEGDDWTDDEDDLP